jgi:hypothetical protein
MVLFGEAVELLLFIDEAVSVTVLILDELEHELPLGVFVRVVVLVCVPDEVGVLLERGLAVTENVFQRIVAVFSGLNVVLFVEIDVLLDVGEDE